MNLLRLSVIFLCLLESGRTFAANSPGSGSAVIVVEQKSHVLFMGADFAFEQGQKFFPVKDVTATNLIIDFSGKPAEVPLTMRANLLIKDSLKIAATGAQIDRLKFERAYANGSDPFDQVSRSAALAASNTALADIARGEVMRANMGVMSAPSGSAAADRPAAEANRAEAEAAFGKALDAPNSEVYDVAGQSVKISGEEMFDAIRVSFQITAETDLAQAYVAVVAQIREQNQKYARSYKSAYLQPVGSMTAGVAKKILVYRGGLPKGYVLEDCEVHLYNRGEELPTNLSHRRVSLTEAQAADFRVIEYVEANRGRTLPATRVTTTIPNEERARLASRELDETNYVRVAKDGRVLAAFRDAAAKQSLQDSAVEALLKTLRFNPALENGKPVESTVAVNLAQLGAREKE